MSSTGAGFVLTTAVSPAEKRRDRRTILLRLLFSVLFLAASLWLITAALKFESFFGAYFVFSRNASAAIAVFFSLFPFSFSELLVAVLILLLVFATVLFLRRLILRKRKMATFLRFLSLLLLLFSIASFLFVALWGLNYFSAPLSKKLDLNVKNTSAEELIDATLISLKYANYYSDKVSRDETGRCDFGNFSEMAQKACEATVALTRRFQIFEVRYCPPPKPVYASKVMSYFGITGIYFPFTAESNVNTDYVVSDLPFVMTHELSHRLGIAPEDEANFMAFLACAESSDPGFIYSGYLSAYLYALDQVYSLSPDAAREIIAMQSDKVLFDIRVLNEYLTTYEGPLSDAGAQINNVYLRSMGQNDGVQSYGRMVDLLIAYYNSPLFSEKPLG